MTYLLVNLIVIASMLSFMYGLVELFTRPAEATGWVWLRYSSATIVVTSVAATFAVMYT